MSLAVIHSRTLDGLTAAPVSVEVKESLERVRAALLNSGLAFPTTSASPST